MKIIRPFIASDVSLVSSTVSATDPAASGSWAVGTTYPLGQVVQVDSPTFTFTASGAVITATGHGFSDGEKLKVASSGTLPGGLLVNTLYYIVQSDADTFKLASAKNGSPIITTSAGTGTHTATVSTHLLYESLQAANVGNTPHKSPTWWLPLRATNRWRVFDDSISVQTENADSMTYVLQATGRVDSVALLNVSAQSVTITARESGGGAIVYGPVTTNLIELTESSFWSWFFEPITRKTTYVGVGIFPMYTAMEITITLTDTGNTAQCGVIVVGLSQVLGQTTYGASVGITDYSVKSVDDFGNTVVAERAFRNIGNFKIVCEANSSDSIIRTLAMFRATPILYVGSEGYSSTQIYGFYRDHNVVLEAYTYSILSLDVEGLT